MRSMIVLEWARVGPGGNIMRHTVRIKIAHQLGISQK